MREGDELAAPATSYSRDLIEYMTADACSRQMLHYRIHHTQPQANEEDIIGYFSKNVVKSGCCRDYKYSICSTVLFASVEILRSLDHGDLDHIILVLRLVIFCYRPMCSFPPFRTFSFTYISVSYSDRGYRLFASFTAIMAGFCNVRYGIHKLM